MYLCLKKNWTDYDDKNFVELVRVDNGELKKLQNKSTYSIIKDYFAKRTFEESGDYAVSEFGVDLGESLDNKLSNGGFFVETQKTEQNNDPSEDLYCARYLQVKHMLGDLILSSWITNSRC